MTKQKVFIILPVLREKSVTEMVRILNNKMDSATANAIREWVADLTVVQSKKGKTNESA